MSKDNELLDFVKRFFGLNTERDLAKRISISDSTLFKIRKEVSSLTTKQRLKIAVAMGLLKDISEPTLMNRIKTVTAENEAREQLLKDELTNLIGREERAQEAFEEAEKNIISSLVYIKTMESVLTKDEFVKYNEIAEKLLVA